jgi:hypothetical protein
MANIIIFVFIALFDDRFGEFFLIAKINWKDRKNKSIFMV